MTAQYRYIATINDTIEFLYSSDYKRNTDGNKRDLTQAIRDRLNTRYTIKDITKVETVKY